MALGHWFEQIAVPQCAAGPRSSRAARGQCKRSSQPSARPLRPASAPTARHTSRANGSAAKLTNAPLPEPHGKARVDATHEARKAAGHYAGDADAAHASASATGIAPEQAAAVCASYGHADRCWLDLGRHAPGPIMSSFSHTPVRFYSILRIFRYPANSAMAP